MKILVVDDSLIMRRIVIEFISELGLREPNHSVSQAEDGKIALEMIREHVPDLVICDWYMPKMLGIELLHALNEEKVKLKFIFATTEGHPTYVLEGKKAGALYHITKPFTLDKFKRALGVANVSY